MSSFITNIAGSVVGSEFNNWAFNVGADVKATAAWSATAAAISTFTTPIIAVGAGLLTTAVTNNPLAGLVTGALAAGASEIASSEVATHITNEVVKTPITKKQSRTLLGIYAAEITIIGLAVGSFFAGASFALNEASKLHPNNFA